MHDWETALGAFDDYLKVTKGVRSSTRKGYRCHLRTLAAMGPAGPADVDELAVAGWLSSRGPSRRNAWAAARSFFGWAQRAGVTMASPVAELAPRRRASRANFPPAWEGPVAKFLSTLEGAGRAVRTTEVYTTYLRRFARDHPQPWAVTYTDVTRWLGRHGHWAPSTRQSALKALRLFYAEAVRRGEVEQSPACEVAVMKVPRAFPRPASTRAVGGALEAASDRDALMVLLGAFAGLRAAEIAAVRPSTDVEDGWLYVRGKGGHERRVPVHPVLEAAINAELARRAAGGHGTGWRNVSHLTADGFLFPAVGGGHITPGTVTRRLSALLPDGVTAHTLRHRFASAAYANCLDIRAVQELLGHASPTTTARYTAVPARQLVDAVRGITA